MRNKSNLSPWCRSSTKVEMLMSNICRTEWPKLWSAVCRRFRNSMSKHVRAFFVTKVETPTRRQIGKELNVQAILTGRVIQRGQDLTLYITLVEAATENVLWKQTYNKTMTNLVVLQNGYCPRCCRQSQSETIRRGRAEFEEKLHGRCRSVSALSQRSLRME